MKHRRRRMRGGADGDVKPDVTPDVTPSDVTPDVTPKPTPEAAVDPPFSGGRSRRSKSRKSKSRKTRRGSRKSSKKRTPGKWISHVKKFAKDNNVSFKEAMSSAGCKNSYKKL